MDELITDEQLEILDYLYDQGRKASIRTKKDIIALGEIFDEDE